jgi:hypothetical protein
MVLSHHQQCSSKSLVKMRMSSMYTHTMLQLMRSLKISFIIVWNLEGGQAVRHAIQHYQWFKQSSVTPKGHFPFIPSLDLDVLVAPSDIEFGEVFGTT